MRRPFARLSVWLAHHVRGVLLLIALAHGLAYVFLIPPWEHYDEPTHFEYAWLIANRLTLPKEDDYDQSMRREVAASMLEHGFFDRAGFKPNLLAEGEPVWIGLSQLRHPPVYYVAASLPLFLMRYADVTLQLYAARLLSLCLFLVTVVAAWGVVSLLVPPGHPLRWMVPAFLALLPGYVDLMTAVNSDVGATALFSLFLWATIYLIQRGWSWKALFAVVTTGFLCFLTKETVLIAVPLGILALLLGLLRGPRRRWVWGLFALVAAGGTVAAFGWGDATLWYRENGQDIPTRVSARAAPLGQHALQLQLLPSAVPQTLLQLIPLDDVRLLQDRTVTLGAWMWASEPVQARGPILAFDGTSFSTPLEIQLGTQPAFHAQMVIFPKDTVRSWVSLAPQDKPTDKEVRIYYGGLVLAEGERPLDQVPQFTSEDGSVGFWGGKLFRNLLRNPSGEVGSLRTRPWVDRVVEDYFFSSTSQMLASVSDWQGAGWYQEAAVRNLLATFWAKFGWGEIVLSFPGIDPYLVLSVVTVAGIGGAAWFAWRRRRNLPWHAAAYVALALAGVWTAADMRGAYSLWSPIFIPSARYAYPVIVPTALVLNAGWLTIARGIGKFISRRYVGVAVFWALLICLDVISLITNLRFYTIR